MRGGQTERRPVAGRQQFRFTGTAAVPHRTDGMDDVLRRQPVARRDLGFAGVAAAECLALGAQLRPGRAMDRAIDPAAAQ